MASERVIYEYVTGVEGRDEQRRTRAVHVAVQGLQVLLSVGEKTMHLRPSGARALAEALERAADRGEQAGG